MFFNKIIFVPFKREILWNFSYYSIEPIINEFFCSDESESGEYAETEEYDVALHTLLLSEEQCSNPKRMRPTKEILTPRLATVLDNLKISSRGAVHLLVAVLDAVRLDKSEHILNCNSIREHRDILRRAKIKYCIRISNKLSTIDYSKLLSSVSGHYRIEQREI